MIKPRKVFHALLAMALVLASSAGLAFSQPYPGWRPPPPPPPYYRPPPPRPPYYRPPPPRPPYYQPPPPPIYRPGPPRPPAAGYLSPAHVQWCLNRYRSYNPRTNMYLSYGGRYRVCRSPYG